MRSQSADDVVDLAASGIERLHWWVCWAADGTLLHHKQLLQSCHARLAVLLGLLQSGLRAEHVLQVLNGGFFADLVS
jgi:hypothetical protein